MSQYLHRGKTWRYETTVRMPDGTKERITGKGNANTRAATVIAERDHVERLTRAARVAPAPEPVSPRVRRMRINASITIEEE